MEGISFLEVLQTEILMSFFLSFFLIAQSPSMLQTPPKEEKKKAKKKQNTNNAVISLFLYQTKINLKNGSDLIWV